MGKLSLQSIAMEQICPIISLNILAYNELKMDEATPFVQPEQIPHLIEQAVSFGKTSAKQQVPVSRLLELINRLLQQKIRICFADRHPTDPQIRAQYHRGKQPKITIFRSSIEQMQHFFQQHLGLIDLDDLYALHLVHEWFHHLEETQLGRTDKRLAIYSKQAWGPKKLFTAKRPIHRTREIAAHAFTQEMMQLKWSPLLLDHLLAVYDKNEPMIRIGEYFQSLTQQYEQIQQTHPQ